MLAGPTSVEGDSTTWSIVWEAGVDSAARRRAGQAQSRRIVARSINVGGSAAVLPGLASLVVVMNLVELQHRCVRRLHRCADDVEGSICPRSPPHHARVAASMVSVVFLVVVLVSRFRRGIMLALSVGDRRAGCRSLWIFRRRSARGCVVGTGIDRRDPVDDEPALSASFGHASTRARQGRTPELVFYNYFALRPEPFEAAVAYVPLEPGNVQDLVGRADTDTCAGYGRADHQHAHRGHARDADLHGTA